ncbi:hypothetical protein [Bacillus sp. FSL R12-0069]|uniref:hypothetical protein n=1 Tax=Bacillus sp. FSL R12-0069 TaxID=2975342 RepID=UPI0030F51BC5
MYYDYDEFYSRPQVSIGTGGFPTPVVSVTPPSIGIGVSPNPVVPTISPAIGTGVYPTNPGTSMPFIYQQIVSLNPQQKQVLMCWLTQQQYGVISRPPFTYEQIASLNPQQKQVLMYWLQQGQYGVRLSPEDVGFIWNKDTELYEYNGKYYIDMKSFNKALKGRLQPKLKLIMKGAEIAAWLSQVDESVVKEILASYATPPDPGYSGPGIPIWP